MVFAGAIEFEPHEVALIMGVLAAVALAVCATGGILAWLIARRAAAFWVGGLAFGVVAACTADALDGLAFGAGWLASIGVGLWLRSDPRSKPLP